VHGVFAEPARVGEGLTCDARLRAEVDGQLRGVYRLAGGAYRQLKAAGAGEVSLQGLTDGEDVHCWHRLYWAVRYARAAAAGHDKALGALRERLTAWLDGRKSGEAYAAYTAAERICSIAEVLFWSSACEPGLTEEFRLKLKQQVRRDARLLAGKVEYRLGVHNHLLNDARGLYAAGAVLPECAEGAQWQRMAFELWEHFFPLLLLEDGTLDEQSSHYHVLLCRTALEYALAARQHVRGLPEGLETKLAGMFRLANDLLRRDGTLPRFGDNSPDRIAEDLWGLMAAAHARGLLDEAPRHGRVTMLTRYYGGERGGRHEAEEGARMRLYANGGFAFLRSDSGETEVAVQASPRAKAGAHGDSGRGSFEVWHQGRVIVREPGCYLGPAGSRAGWYRSAEAQNVTSVEGLAPAVLLDEQRRMAEWYWADEGAWRYVDGQTLEFESGAFGRVRRDLRVRRRWSLDEAGEFVFEEVLSGRGELGLRSRVFLGDGRWVAQRDERGGQWVLRPAAEDGPALRLVLSLPEGAAAEVVDAQFTPEYGIEHPAQVLIWTGKLQLPCRWGMRSERGSVADRNGSVRRCAELQASTTH
jgi:hypothetical protein